MTTEEKKEIRLKRKCDTCNERFEFIIKNYQIKLIVIFFKLLMFYYIDTTTQITHIVKNTGLLEKNYRTAQSSSDNTLRDFLDGEFYKRILNSRIGSAIKRKEAFTMNFNTDGISLSETSTLSPHSTSTTTKTSRGTVGTISSIFT